MWVADQGAAPRGWTLTDRLVWVARHSGAGIHEHRLAVERAAPRAQRRLAHGGRGWFYDAAAFMALTDEHVWIELPGLLWRHVVAVYGRDRVTASAGRIPGA